MSTKAHIPIVADILSQKGVSDVVIAPGSRNAPLIQAFYQLMPQHCHSIVDERSAGYFALGLAIKKQAPVVVITTSGTAVLNLYPAIAEAYLQGVPLIILTADRPAEWIGQQDNQAISQRNVFANNIKASFELPVECTHPDELWHVNRIVNEAYNISVSGVQGPTHINIPLREPLYEPIKFTSKARIINVEHLQKVFVSEEITQKWNAAKSIVVCCGQMAPNEQLKQQIATLAEDQRVVVMCEPISNISEGAFVSADFVFTNSQLPQDPDLVIYTGGQIVSKRTKNYLRKLQNTAFCLVNEEGKHIDTFLQLDYIIRCSPSEFFTAIQKLPVNSQSIYQQNWRTAIESAKKKADSFSKDVPFSDLSASKMLTSLLSKKDIVFAGNSSIIRYLQMFELNAKEVYANRGTSGIDGCVSTAVGIAKACDSTVVAVVGDLSFIYDSNGLWNKNLPQNLKIIILNNNGGGIFSMIDGPRQQSSFSKFFEAHHPVDIKSMAHAFGVEYFGCSNAETLTNKYHEFYACKGAAILEIETNNEVNTSVFSTFIENICRHE